MIDLMLEATNIDISVGLAILRQDTGRFDHRFGIGPACWNFWDLLWIHEGEVRLELGKDRQKTKLIAPAGILIAPNTTFKGRAIGPYASASIHALMRPKLPARTGVISNRCLTSPLTVRRRRSNISAI